MTRGDGTGDSTIGTNGASQDGRDDLDAPTPPGGPQRTDAPDPGGTHSGEPALDPGPEVERVTKREDTGTAPPPAHDDARDPSPAESAQQAANAEQSEYGEPSQ